MGKGRVDALAALATPLFPKIEFADIDLIIENDDDDILEVGESIELLTILSNHPDWGYAENVVGVLEVVERKSLNCFLLFGKPIAVNQSCNSR